MLVLRLKGGLGNQIFQVVHAIDLAQPNERIFIDYSHFFYQFHQDYAGADFVIGKILTQEQLSKLRFFKTNPMINKAVWKILNLLRLTNKNLIAGLRLLDGYFHQASLYSVGSSYRPLLNLKNDLYSKLIDKNSVLIHVRKGDYTNSVNSKIYYNCDTEYFKRCIQIMNNHNPNAKYFIVSNDNAWIKENFDFLPSFTIIEAPDALETFKVMCQFSNFIISNSTFSWWPAFLAQASLVIAPQKWFLDESKNNDLYPIDWIKVK